MKWKFFLVKLEWIIDYYLVCFTYNPHKKDQYEKYMIKKWDFKNRYYNPVKSGKAKTKSQIKFTSEHISALSGINSKMN